MGRASPERSATHSQTGGAESKRKRLVSAALAATSIAAPGAAPAQNPITTGDAAEVTGIGGGIAVEHRPAFRDHIVQEQVPNYTILEAVAVGTVLPDTG
jgi:hypothetical protein